MTRNSKHLKRYAIPRSWTISRKEEVLAVKPSPGPHRHDHSIPLMVALRDILQVGKTSAEVRKILGRREVMVDGRIKTSYKHPIGLMDIISIPKIERHFRVMINPRGQIVLRKVEKNESVWKLVRIENKVVITQGKTQLNLHDGRNIILKKNDYKTGDVLKISLPDQKIISSYPLKEEMIAVLIGGAHIGGFARVKKAEKTKGPAPNLVEFHEGFNTITDHVFIVGAKTSEIGSGEVAL